MYTGKTGKPCCLCGREDTDARIDLPPRAIPEMKNSGPIAWRDVVGEVSLHFCADDWEVVRDLAIEMGMSPLSRCNAARADFDLRADFEALNEATKERQDHDELEARMLDERRSALTDPDAEDRKRVEAVVIDRLLADDGDVGTTTGTGD